MPLDDDVIRLAKGKNLATVATLMPDGQPQALLTWVDTDGEVILVNTEPQRQRSRNVAKDPRVTVLIHSAEDPWDWADPPHRPRQGEHLRQAVGRRSDRALVTADRRRGSSRL